MHMTFRTTTPLAGLLLLAACASAGDYPSLARRDAERISATADPVQTDPSVPVALVSPDASLVDRLAHLESQAESAHRRFHDQLGRTEALVGEAHRAEIASESWSVASVALAGLEAARSESMIALAELDGLHAAERVAHYNTESGDGQAITALRDRVMALVAEEDRILADLRGQIR